MGRGGFCEGLRPSTPFLHPESFSFIYSLPTAGLAAPQKLRGLRRLFCTPDGVPGEIFFLGLRPAPLFVPQANPGHDRDSHLLEKKGPFFLGKFLFYLFPAMAGSVAPLKLVSFAAFFGPSTTGGESFLRGFAPMSLS